MSIFNEKFPCTSCGCCCKKLKIALDNSKNSIHPGMIKAAEDFPYDWDENGSCVMLDKNNQCSVYETRPLFCRADDLGKVFGFENQTELKEWRILYAKACNAIMDEQNISKEYRIPIE